MKVFENLDLEAFGKEFLSAYLADGYTAMTKREIDLLVLRLLIEHRKGWSWDIPPSAFELSKSLRAKRSRIRSMMDELSFRDLADETKAKERLRTVITARLHNGADDLYENGKVRLQIEDGFLREYAKDLVQRNYGIVDSSFDRSIVVLSEGKFLALALEVTPSPADAAIEQELAKHKESLVRNGTTTLTRGFIEHVKKGAGEEVGKQAVRLGIAAITGGVSELPGLVGWFFDNENITPTPEEIEVVEV